MPPPGEVWLDERLTAALSAAPGSRVKLGNAELRVGAVLTLEPDRGANFFNIAPRLMMNLDDVPATGLIQTGSRVTYQLFAAGEREVPWMPTRCGQCRAWRAASASRTWTTRGPRSALRWIARSASSA